MRHVTPALAFFIAVASIAQTPKSGTGTVTGHVYCADTNAPARMASVQLKPVEAAPASSASDHIFDSGSQPGGVVQTAMDGSFVLTGIPPGSYYVVVAAAGYLSSAPDPEDTDKSQKQPLPEDHSLHDTPRVQVQADQTANIEIRLERGAAISGTVLYDDGSPVVGAEVVALHKKKDKWVPFKNFVPMMIGGPTNSTDDLGHYRLSGLKGQVYILEVRLNRTDLVQVGQGHGPIRASMRSSLQVYSGDTPRISNAVPFKIRAGEERTGEDITIPLSKFHTVSGVVTAARDGHTLREAFVALDDPHSKNTIAGATSSEDGTFIIDCVPEGTYLLRVVHAADRQEQTIKAGKDVTLMLEDKIIHSYGPLEQTLKVESDVNNLVLSVPEQQPPTTASSSR